MKQFKFILPILLFLNNQIYSQTKEPILFVDDIKFENVPDHIRKQYKKALLNKIFQYGNDGYEIRDNTHVDMQKERAAIMQKLGCEGDADRCTQQLAETAGAKLYVISKLTFVNGNYILECSSNTFKEIFSIYDHPPISEHQLYYYFDEAAKKLLNPKYVVNDANAPLNENEREKRLAEQRMKELEEERRKKAQNVYHKRNETTYDWDLDDVGFYSNIVIPGSRQLLNGDFKKGFMYLGLMYYFTDLAQDGYHGFYRAKKNYNTINNLGLYYLANDRPLSYEELILFAGPTGSASGLIYLTATAPNIVALNMITDQVGKQKDKADLYSLQYDFIGFFSAFVYAFALIDVDGRSSSFLNRDLEDGKKLSWKFNIFPQIVPNAIGPQRETHTTMGINFSF